MSFGTRHVLGLAACGLLLIAASAQPAAAAGPAAPGRPAAPAAAWPGNLSPALRPPADLTNHNGRMPPGWDWWRTYPWSPYNAWRNPYWYPPYNPSYPFPPDQAYPDYSYPVPPVPPPPPVPPVPLPGGIGFGHR